MSAPAPSMFTPAAKAMAEKLGLKMGRANLDEFAATLEELAKANPNIVAVTSDSRGSGKLAPFGKALPKQLVEVGIAEQNLVGITAGLAACGKKSFGVSPGCFLTARSLEQIKNDICYSDVPAVLVGISSGVSYGALGTTHHSLHDLAVLRAINNITISFRQIILKRAKPSVLRPKPRNPCSSASAKRRCITCTSRKRNLKPAKPSHCAKATMSRSSPPAKRSFTRCSPLDKLAEQGLNCRVLSMHTIKPLDTEAILKAGRECRAVVTVEEHMVHGGLGEACASVLMQAGVNVPFRIVGIPDEETVPGAQADIFRHYGISMEGLSKLAASLL